MLRFCVPSGTVLSTGLEGAEKFRLPAMQANRQKLRRAIVRTFRWPEKPRCPTPRARQMLLSWLSDLEA
jgi:hypothetical protein